MLHSFKDLLDHTIATNGGKAKLREAFFDPSGGVVRHLAVDIGSWLETVEVIVDADRLAPPRDEGAPWTLHIADADLERAPRWHEGMAEHQPDMTYWPPVLVGPFGSTYSPVLLLEQILAEQGHDDDESEAPDGDALVRPLQEASGWIGLPAFGGDGEIGTVADLLFDAHGPRVIGVVIDPVRDAHRTGRVQLPLTSLRHRPQQGTHLVFDTTLEALDRDPA